LAETEWKGPTRRRHKVNLRVRVSCTAPSPEAEEAWNQYLLRILRRAMAEDSVLGSGGSG